MTRTDSLAAVALVVFWSSGFIGAELGTAQVSAHTLLAWRYVVAASILVLWCWKKGLRPTRLGLRRLSILGVVYQFLYLGLVVAGVGAGVPPGVAALIAALQPLVVAMLASRVLSERVGTAKKVGLVVGFSGVLLVVLGDLGGAHAPWPVYLLPFAGMLALAGGTVYEQRVKPTEPLALSMAIQSVVAAVLFMTWSLVAGDAAPPMTAGFAVAVAWVVVLSTFGAFGTYMFVVRRSGATRASALLYLTPATTMVWAFFMFGDRITWVAVLGVFVTLAGLGGPAVVARLRTRVTPPDVTGREVPQPSRPAART